MSDKIKHKKDLTKKIKTTADYLAELREFNHNEAADHLQYVIDNLELQLAFAESERSRKRLIDHETDNRLAAEIIKKHWTGF